MNIVKSKNRNTGSNVYEVLSSIITSSGLPQNVQERYRKLSFV
ncbi:MAG TPA: hypothetical protein P5052_02000 [Candidatus Paceibacterota bacterium]|nr:hypothetical protein [Candidatus Paceibacterota bacterium]